MTDERAEHWEAVYRDKEPTEVSWYQREPTISLELIEAAGAGAGARIIDVGGGASTLVDHLLDRGYGELTVVDISGAALERARERLAERAEQVSWLREDVTALHGLRPFDVWHDRAVFHFLVHEEDRRRYVRALREHLVPGGHAIVATFALHGPEKCSGLPVRRYDPQSLRDELGDGFELLDSREEDHQTPAGREQAFTYCLFARRA